MQAQIRMGESGHSYHYSGLITVHALMQQLRKDFKIELEDQKIIAKSGELLKSTMSFASLQDSMRKTIITNTSPLNPSLNTSEVKEIQCFYIYNQKELLKPIETKPFNEDHHLKLHRDKFKEMSLLAQNSYELQQFNDKISQKNILPIIESLSKKLKIPFENITDRYSRFHENLKQREYYKIQITSLLDLIQNQDKARKLLIKNVQWTHDKKTKRKLFSLKEKLQKQAMLENQTSMKQNSQLLSSQKDNFYTDALKEHLQIFAELQNKNQLFFEKLKNSKKQVTKKKFQTQEKVTFRIDKKITSNQKEFEKNIKEVKYHFEQICEEIIKVHSMLTKNKESKEAIKELMFINQKIVNFEKLLEQSVKEFTQMYLELTKIHVKGESQNIKIVFGIYVDLIKTYEELEIQVRKFEKQFVLYSQQKSSREIKVSEFTENKVSEMPLKKPIKSPKKQENSKRLEKWQQNSVIRQPESQMPKINSPIKNKICKNNLKNFNDEGNLKSFQNAIKENKELQRRLEFNRRLESLAKYCRDLCDREYGFRRNFKNSKDFQDNKIDLLNVFNVPTIELDFSQTSDAELTQTYKKFLKENTLKFQTQLNWEIQVVELSNTVSKTLKNFLESTNNPSQRQKSMEKIMAVMSETFYKMMKVKIEKEIEHMRKSISKNVKNQDKELIESLMRSNDDFQKEITSLQLEVKRLSQENRSSLEFLEESITPQTHELLSQKYHELLVNFRSLEEDNEVMRGQNKSLEAQLLAYQEEVKQTTQKLIESYEEQNAAELEKLNNELKGEKQLNSRLNKEVKDLRTQLEVGKKNLLKQMKSIESLFEKIEELNQEKDFYEKQFSELKGLLADKEVAIIKLEKHIENMTKQFQNQKSQTKKLKEQFEQNDFGNKNEGQHECEYSEEVIELRQKNQELQMEIENLEKELKEILYKETIDQEVQTSEEIITEEQEYRIRKGKENIFMASSLQDNRETSKLSSEQKHVSLHQNPMMNELATKQAHLNNFNISHDQNFNIEHHAAVSQYYVSSMGQQWVTSVFNKFTHLAVGKTIEEGMNHIFLPFSSDIYIGVTTNDDSKNFTNYQEYLNHESSRNVQRLAGDPIYVLDLKEFNFKTNEMLRECSLVLVVKIQKKGEVSMGNKIMVSGKIEFALGFEDDDMVIKNYSHFLEE